MEGKWGGCAGLERERECGVVDEGMDLGKILREGVEGVGYGVGRGKVDLERIKGVGELRREWVEFVGGGRRRDKKIRGVGKGGGDGVRETW